VLADMEKEKLPVKNQSLIDNTNANRLFTLVGEGPELAALYNHWADMLQKEKKKGGGGGGGGGQSDGKIPPELLMELLQMIQNEQGVRSETRAANEIARQRREAADARPADAAEAARQAAEAAAQADARKVGARQIELREELAGLLDKYNPPPSDDPNDALDDALADAVPGFGEYSGKGSENKLPPDLVELMGRTGKAMGDAASLLGQGETSSPAIAAETEALELLALLFEKSAEKSPSQATGMMQQMKEAMMAGGKPGDQSGKKPGGKPGSKPGQGSTGSGSVAAGNHGTHSGDTENRENEKATGKIPGHIPPEYRGAIETYHNRLDKLTAAKPAGGKKP
jgi:hypothetical protein